MTMCNVDLLVLFFSQEDSDPAVHESLSIENTLWASTVVASGKCCNIKHEHTSKTSSVELYFYFT